MYLLLADFTVFLHFAFILFVLAGGLIVWRWPWLSLLHLPAALWGALIEFRGWLCPLTPLENYLRKQGGGRGYQTGFIEHYLIPLIYPEGLTEELQLGLGLAVLFINGLIYGLLLFRYSRR